MGLPILLHVLLIAVLTPRAYMVVAASSAIIDHLGRQFPPLTTSAFVGWRPRLNYGLLGRLMSWSPTLTLHYFLGDGIGLRRSFGHRPTSPTPV